MEKVDVYRNLTKKCYSIRKNGLVINHMKEVYMKDVEFIISKAGQKRAREQKRRNVHAVLRGSIVSDEETILIMKKMKMERIKYNPFFNDNFVQNKKNINKSNFVILTTDGCYGEK